MKNLIKFTEFILILIFLTSCKTQNNIEPSIINNSSAESKEKLLKDKKRMEFQESCGENDIENFLKDGWTIVKEYSEEKICTWKSYPATKNCNMEKDKGCKITKPDKIGEEKTYILERKNK